MAVRQRQMRLDRVGTGDVIKARIKGRSLWGEVTQVKDGIVYFSPISRPPGGGTRPRARSSVTGARRDGAPSGGDDDARGAGSRGQLSLPGEV
jgi:hypothetical protein